MDNNYKTTFFYKITLLYLAIVFLGMFSGDSEKRVYIVTIVYILAYILSCVFSKTFFFNKQLIIIPMLFICVWIYGLLRGLSLRNDHAYILRNFAGMSCYFLIFPLFASGISLSRIKKLVIFFSYIALILPIFTWIEENFLGRQQIIVRIPILNAYVGGPGSIGVGFIQYFNRELIFVAFSIAFYDLIFEHNKSLFKNTIVILATIFFEFFINDSGGDRLALALLTIVIIFSNFRKARPIQIFLVAIIPIAYIIVSLKLETTPIEMLFSSSDGGNQKRILELNYFKQNFNLFGLGLGSRLGLSWLKENTYATELIYLNIFHKFGIFAVVIIASYIYTVVRCINFLQRRQESDATIPLALMAYLIPAIANPMLFSVLAVVSHCLTLIFLNEERDYVG